MFINSEELKQYARKRMRDQLGARGTAVSDSDSLRWGIGFMTAMQDVIDFLEKKEQETEKSTEAAREATTKNGANGNDSNGSDLVEKVADMLGQALSEDARRAFNTSKVKV